MSDSTPAPQPTLRSQSLGVEGLTVLLTTIRDSVDDVKQHLGRMEIQIEKLAEKYQSAELHRARMEGEITGLKKDVGDLKGQVGELKVADDSLREIVQSNQLTMARLLGAATALGASGGGVFYGLAKVLGGG